MGTCPVFQIQSGKVSQFESVYGSSSHAHYAGVDVILGTDVMIPAGVRLDLFRSKMKNPEEVVVALIKSQREVDEQSSAKHVPGSPNDALDVPPGSVVEFKLRRNSPSWITHE
ncbi:unnamed protein product [Phytophthora fragariaefolia]|uniref:Unnamed protein product n=1 Tax=Phytophthora fragariaefolia TaxID=1490495 RepID=A0A9W6YGH1_9STRA|nr:unnamed protein product [Phytophthora fragariaefolia]